MPIKHYKVSELQAGMVLAQQIMDENGRVVMQEGSRLTPMYIKRLPNFNVESVAVEEEEAAGDEPSAEDTTPSALKDANAEDKEFMRRIAERVQDRFTDVSDIPVMAELKRLAVRHLVLAGPGTIPGVK